MNADAGTQLNNAATNKAQLSLPPSRPTTSSSNQKFSAAGQPAGITSSSKMLGENRYNPSSSETTTDPFASIPRFPDKHRTMDGDERSSITSASDNDDTVLVGEDGKLRPAPGKKTRGRVKIQMEYIQNKLRRYTTFSKRKSGIMKKAYELSTLTGTQVMLLVASETGHVYTFATPKLQPMITSEAGKALIQTCLHQPDPPSSVVNPSHPNVGDYDVRMSSTGYEETDLGYNNLPEEDFKGGLVDMHHLSTSAQMPTILGAGPIVTIPHGMMHMPSYSTSSPIVCESQPLPSQTLMAPLHQMQTMLPMSSTHQVISPHHSPPPPTYSPPHHQPASPQRTYTPNSYPGSPPSATPYSQAHQTVMMHEELGSPMGHHGIDSYDRSPSRSPIRYSSPHHVHSPPQAVYSAPHGSPPMAGHHSPIMRI